MKGGLGFPSSGTGGNSNQNKPTYKADTSKYKSDVIEILKKS